MLSEADLLAKRAALRWFAERHPHWTHQELAETLGMSRSWVSKWLQRLRQADPADVMALHSRSRARHTPPASIASQPAVVQRILEIRTEPPEHLQRVPGPEAILYYLHRDPSLIHADLRLPRSQTTIWKILRQLGCIEENRRRKPRPLEPRQPGEEVQFDLKDASSVPADPEGKRQHVVEIANFVDAGTSIWLHRQVGAEFDAEALLEVVAQFLREHGLPAMLTFDNDPRFVGSSSGRDFPSALVRFLWCVGVTPNIILPHRPDLNAYVERFHRSSASGMLAGASAAHSRASSGGHRGVSLPLQRRASQPGTHLGQPTASCSLRAVPDPACCATDRRSRPLARASEQASFCANYTGWWRCDDQSPGLLREPKAGRPAGHLLGERS
jgi:transposase InsO family protein